MRCGRMTFVALLLVAGSLNADEPLLFSDSFATLSPGWGQPSESKSVSDGHLVLSLKPNRIHCSLYTGAKFANADIRAKLVQKSGEPEQTAGIVFWAEDVNNYYVARIRSDGRVLIGRSTRDKWLNPANDRQLHESIQTGFDKVNELRVVTAGRSAKVFVNGRELASIRGFPPTEESFVGLFAESGEQPCVWHYSEFEVRQGPADSIAGATRGGELWHDDFSTFDPGWGTISKVQRVENGNFVIDLDPGLRHTTRYQGSLFDDIDIRVKVAEAKGDLDQPAGIIFWVEDGENFVTFVIQSDGTPFIKRYRKGKAPVVNELKPPKGIRKGLGQFNELRVVTKGKSAQLIINDEKLATYTGFPPEAGSGIGLLATSGDTPSTWMFSDLVVRASE